MTLFNDRKNNRVHILCRSPPVTKFCLYKRDERSSLSRITNNRYINAQTRIRTFQDLTTILTFITLYQYLYNPTSIFTIIIFKIYLLSQLWKRFRKLSSFLFSRSYFLRFEGIFYCVLCASNFTQISSVSRVHTL